MNWKKEGLLLEYRSPEGESMPKEFKDPGSWYASRFAVMAIAINTKYVPKGSIKSYTDLVKPEFVEKWKGKVTGSDPRYRGTGVEQYFALRERYGPEWWKPFAKLNIKWATGGAQEESWLASGEVVASIGPPEDAARHPEVPRPAAVELADHEPPPFPGMARPPGSTTAPARRAALGR